MMKKERVYYLIFGLILVTGAWGEVSALEKLWNIVIKTNVDIENAVIDEQISEKEMAGYWKEFLPGVVFSANSDVGVGSSFYEKLPDYIGGNVSINQKLPLNMYLSVTPELSLMKGVKSFDDDLTKENLKYSDYANVGIYIAATLNSASFEDTDRRRLLLNVDSARLMKEMAVKEKIEEVTKNFIDYRQTFREVDSLELMISYYESLLEALHEKTNKSMEEVFQLENTLYELEENLIEKKQNLINLNENLQNLMSSKDFNSKFLQEIDFFDELPEIKNHDFSKNYNKDYLDLQRKILKNDYKTSRKNNSALLKMGVNIEENKWKVSASLDFGDFQFGKNNELKEIFKKNSKKIDRLDEKYERLLETEQQFYERQLIFAVELENEFKKNYDNSLRIFNAMKESFETGTCSKQDFLQAENTWKIRKIKLLNNQDAIWYYNWMVKNRSYSD